MSAPDYTESEISSAIDEEPSVIVQLTNRVQDGTRCRSGSLDMCIKGKCQVSELTFFPMRMFSWTKIVSKSTPVHVCNVCAVHHNDTRVMDFTDECVR